MDSMILMGAVQGRSPIAANIGLVELSRSDAFQQLRHQDAVRHLIGDSQQSRTQDADVEFPTTGPVLPWPYSNHLQGSWSHACRLFLFPNCR